MNVAPADVDWFARLGQPLTEQESEPAQRYARALGWSDVPVERLGSFAECAALLQRPITADSSWAREEVLRSALRDQLHAQRSEEAWAREFTAVIDPAAEQTNAAAMRAVLRLGVDDPYARYVAGGAALHAIHLYLLARAAHAADHPFIHRFAVFAAGRWLLGGTPKQLYLF